MRYVIAVVLLGANVFAQEILTPAGMGSDKPTVHPITDADRAEARQRCRPAQMKYEYVLKSSQTAAGKMNPETQRALAGYKGEYEQCQRDAAASLEDLRVNGTFAERQQREIAAEMKARREAEQRETDDNEARVESVRRNPKAMAAVFGAIFCETKAVRSAALGEIEKEKKYSRIGGMVNKVKLYKLQQAIRWADETEAEQRKTLKREYKSIVPGACSSKPVRDVLFCLGDDTPNCAGDEPRLLATFVPEYKADDDE